jgi:hypothetical protein
LTSAVVVARLLVLVSEVLSGHGEQLPDLGHALGARERIRREGERPYRADAQPRETEMIKRLVATGAVLGIVALTAGSMGSATGHGSGHDGHHGHHGDQIRVLSTNTEEAFVDVGEPDFSLGDEFIFTSDLTKHGRLVGHTGVVCTTTSVVREESQCVGTASFDKGQITIQGLLAGEPDEFEFPITGGTGAFEGADGTLVVKELSDTQELLIFNLD